MNINRTLGPILATILWISPVAGAADLTLQVQGLDAPSGTLHAALFDEAGWSDNAAIDSAIVEIDYDAPVRFGPPSFACAGFDLPAEGATQTITLR